MYGLLPQYQKARYLRLTPNINPRSVEYAKQLRAENPDPKVLIEKLMARYNKAAGIGKAAQAEA